MAVNKAAVVGLGAAVIAGVLLLMGGKANAAPAEPKSDDVVPPVPPPPGPAVVPILALATFIADRIQRDAWQAFAPPGESDPVTQDQRDAVTALLDFQSRVGLSADGSLGPRTAGALLFFTPGLEPKLRSIVFPWYSATKMAEGRALAEAAAGREGVT